MSLRARLLLAVGTIAILALGITSVATYSLLQSNLYSRVDQSLHFATGAITYAVEHGQQPSRCGRLSRSVPPSSAGVGPTSTAPRGRPDLGSVVTVSYEVRTAKGAVVSGESCAAYVRSRTYSPLLPSVVAGLTRSSPENFTAGSTKSGGPAFRVHASIIANGSTLFVGIPLTDTASTLHTLLVVELIVAGVALLVAILTGFFFVRLGLRPLDDVEETAEAIIEGRFSDRIPAANDRTEIGRLSSTLNKMLDEIEGAFAVRDAVEVELRKRDELQRQFVSDASHELRTPIAAIAAYAELIDHWGSHNPEQLQRVLTGIRGQSQRMEQLVSDLLTLARLDEGAPMRRIRVELVRCCNEVIMTARTVRPQWPIDFQATESVEVIGDPAQLQRVIENLLANVSSHTPQGTIAKVDVRRAGAFARIAVTDNGPGMSDEALGHAFDRFYRSDAGRDRGHGGSGLGLSIVAAMVMAHQGTVDITRASPTGTNVVVRLPLAPELTEGPRPEER